MVAVPAAPASTLRTGQGVFIRGSPARRSLCPRSLAFGDEVAVRESEQQPDRREDEHDRDAEHDQEDRQRVAGRRGLRDTPMPLAPVTVSVVCITL
jgi:hypothetical protein